MDISLTRDIRVPVGDPKLAKIELDRFLIVSLGETAPDFTATDLDGKPVKLSDLHGKVVLLDFWATWCGPCVMEMPQIRRAYEKLGKRGNFVVVGISLDDNPDKVRGFLKQRSFRWLQIVGGPAKENPIARSYHVEGIPANFLIDRDGKVVAKDLRGRDVLRKARKLLRPAKPVEEGAEPAEKQTAERDRQVR